MVWFATLLAHLLILFLIIGVPIRGAQRFRVLMRRIARHPELRSQFYVRGMLSQWLMLIPLVIIALSLGWSLGLQLPNQTFLAFLGMFFAVILVVLFYAQVFYIRRVARTAEGRVRLRQSMSGPLQLLPRTPKERALWVLLSMTAGICEELLYRGFMTAYLTTIFQVHIVLAILIVAVLFGIGHTYQKLTGVLGTSLMGLVFGFLYIFTGSLLLPIIVHALFDMRLLLIDISGIVENSDAEDSQQAASLS